MHGLNHELRGAEVEGHEWSSRNVLMLFDLCIIPLLVLAVITNQVETGRPASFS